ncbi:lactadherin-like [Patiria miniata]|uniref:F5/8 type C domain-containing protein n=1 Tax=Patiria miniata TaxID=46514 RepID=A0A914ABW2_PATMI|nr:lactadherin-like [Patiria miniata]
MASAYSVVYVFVAAEALELHGVLLAGVDSEQRVCYSGPPPEPDPDNPDDWMKQVMQEIRKRCPGKREPTPAECVSHALGMEDRTIPDGCIKASSQYYTNCCPASKARLNNNKRWIPYSDDANPWIEVDLVGSAVVTGVITQGYSSQFVTQYKVSYQKHPSTYYDHVEDGHGNIKVFIGNTDGNTPVTNLFYQSVVATVVRIKPTKWQTLCSLRLELLGCRPCSTESASEVEASAWEVVASALAKTSEA